MAAGFNGARLHQKVFEPRFLYWADKLGYLVWGEAPSWGAHYDNPACERVVLDEWRAEVERDRNHPSIVGWCRSTDRDPGTSCRTPRRSRARSTRRDRCSTRAATSTDRGNVDDAHITTRTRASARVVAARRGSFRALRHRRATLLRQRVRRDRMEEARRSQLGLRQRPRPKRTGTRASADSVQRSSNPPLFGFCYAQLTDVEQERNGLYYHDHAQVRRREAPRDRREAGRDRAGRRRRARQTEGGWRVVFRPGRRSNLSGPTRV